MTIIASLPYLAESGPLRLLRFKKLPKIQIKIANSGGFFDWSKHEMRNKFFRVENQV